MSAERFSAWYFTQPELIQELVVYGPPFLVSVLICLALGGRVRLMLLAWRFDPTLAASFDTLRAQAADDAEAEWTHDAKASVDELVARRSRGLR